MNKGKGKGKKKTFLNEWELIWLKKVFNSKKVLGMLKQSLNWLKTKKESGF